MVEWHFYEKVYRRWLVVTVCTLEELKGDLKGIGYDDYEMLYDAKGMLIRLTPQNTSTNQNCMVLWMPKWDVTTLVHEIAHLVIQAFDDTQVSLSLDNTEAFAFYMEYWFAEIQRVHRRFPTGRSAAEAKR